MGEDNWSKVLGNVNGGGCGEVVCPSAVSNVGENKTVNQTAGIRINSTYELTLIRQHQKTHKAFSFQNVLNTVGTDF